MKHLVVTLIIIVMMDYGSGQYPDCVSCTDGSIPLTPISYAIRNSDVFNGAQPSSDSAILTDCDQGFDGGDYSDLSNTFAWTTSGAQQVSIELRFYQQISINRISMFFWNSPNNSIMVPTVTLAFGDHTMQFTDTAITTNSPNRIEDRRSILNISIDNDNLKFLYLRIRMSFTDNNEWIFLGEVQFCGNTAPFHITQPSTDNDVQIVSPTATMVTLTCSLNITIPSSLFVRWLYNGNLMMGSTNGNTARLQIRNLTAAVGVYQCVFNDIVVGWEIRRNIRLNITDIPTSTLSSEVATSTPNPPTSTVIAITSTSTSAPSDIGISSTASTTTIAISSTTRAITNTVVSATNTSATTTFSATSNTPLAVTSPTTATTATDVVVTAMSTTSSVTVFSSINTTATSTATTSNIIDTTMSNIITTADSSIVTTSNIIDTTMSNIITTADSSIATTSNIIDTTMSNINTTADSFIVTTPNIIATIMSNINTTADSSIATTFATSSTSTNSIPIIPTAASATTSNIPSATASSSSGSNNTIIIAISVVVVILLIGIIITVLIMVCCWRKRKSSYQVYGNDAKEDDQPPPSSPPYASVDIEEKGNSHRRTSVVNNVDYTHIHPLQYAVANKKDKKEKRKSGDPQRRSSIDFNYRPDRSPDLSIQSQDLTLSMVNHDYEETRFDIFSSGVPDIPERTAASHGQGMVFDDEEEENPIYNYNENPIYNEAINPQYIVTDPSATTYCTVDDRVSPYASVYADPLPLIKAEGPPIVSSKNIERVQELGFGLFGEVVLANTKGLSYRYLGIGNSDDSSVSIKVAVKMLKASPSADVQKSFEKEIKFMSRLKNDNVIRLLGICTTGTPFIMMEYMESGDLNKYLQKFKYTYETGKLPATNEITLNALVYMSYQIASGMKYLSSCNFIHRDLAARNVLVGVNYTVKIADFGMSQNLYSEYYCRVEGQKILPIRWMAYECFYGKFSVKTDVWAFGITLWEVFTLCRNLPFEDMTNQQLVDDIDKGPNRCLPKKPDICPDDIYTIMKSCWHHEPSQRAKFTILCDQLHDYYISLF